MKKLFFISALMLTVFCGKVSAKIIPVTLSNGLTFYVELEKFKNESEMLEYIVRLEDLTKGWGNDNPYITQGSSFFGDYDDNPFN